MNGYEKSIFVDTFMSSEHMMNLGKVKMDILYDGRVRFSLDSSWMNLACLIGGSITGSYKKRFLNDSSPLIISSMNDEEYHAAVKSRSGFLMDRKNKFMQDTAKNTEYSRSGICGCCLFVLLFFHLSNVQGSILDDCISTALQTADDSTTVGTLRLECKEKIRLEQWPQEKKATKSPAIGRRIAEEKKQVLQPFTLTAHKPNYLIVGSYNRTGYFDGHFKDQFSDLDYTLQDVEAKFQLSVKFPLLIDIMDKANIYAGYTNRSFWQVYNDKESAPFRETNHEPEIWVQFHPNWEVLGFTNSWNSIGLSHQSNGRDGTLSRSWNRVYGWFTFERGNLGLSFKPWYAIVDKGEDADNPDITDFLGHFSLLATYKQGQNVFSVTSRNNIESGFSKGALEFSWSFPLGKWPYLKGYIQYFTGYGESLIDYNQYVNTLGVGISLTDWL